MTFRHTKLSALNEELQLRKASLSGTIDESAYPYGPLTDFRREVESTLRGVKTVLRARAAGKADTAWVYVEGESMVRGYIGYGDFQSSRHGEKKFAVFARGIENGKYSDYSEQYHMKTSINMAPMLKAARGYLTKYSTKEIEGVLRAPVRDKLQEKAATLRNHASSLLRSFGMSSYGQNGERTLREFKHLIESGHKFFDVQFGDDLRELFVAQEAVDSMGTHDNPMDFVHIYPTPWETRADIVQLTSVDRYSVPDSQSDTLTWVADELPESVKGKIAVLSMCKDSHYVEGVGYKVDDRTFYLHKESDDTWK